MRYRKLDVNGDYTFGKGDANFLVDTPEAVAQAVMTALKLFRGEWFIDISAGVPYLTKVLGFGTMTEYDFEIQDAITGTTGVVEITDYASYYNPSTRGVSIQATINTLYGQTIVSTI